MDLGEKNGWAFRGGQPSGFSAIAVNNETYQHIRVLTFVTPRRRASVGIAGLY